MRHTVCEALEGRLFVNAVPARPLRGTADDGSNVPPDQPAATGFARYG